MRNKSYLSERSQRNALKRFKSYLSERSQRVGVNGGLSSIFPLKHGVPQGSFLDHLLFTIYTSKLFDFVERHLPDVHGYADDTQLYLAFSPDESEAAVEAMRRCIDDLRKCGWSMTT